MDISVPITAISGIGDAYAKKLEKLGIFTVFDLLYHIPFRYEDRTQIAKTGTVQAGETVTITGTLELIKTDVTKRGKMLQNAKINDGSGPINITWFNQSFLTKTLQAGQKVGVYGKVELFVGKKTFLSPEYEILSTIHPPLHLSRIVPIYPETAGLSSKWLRNKIFSILHNLPDTDLISLPGQKAWKQALTDIHFPKTHEDINHARDRLAKDELILYQMKGLLRRSKWQQSNQSPVLSTTDLQLREFTSHLPFTLTPSQSQAINEIRQNIDAPHPMNRLLEGDVGSGKTVVAAAASFIAFKNGYQTLLLAPTQILASQHYATLTSICTKLDMKIALVTGAKKDLKLISQADVIVGTHAILNLELPAKKVGLVIVDEQHRFGVKQRSLATSLGHAPHTLTMTATPIPRSIALTVFGDLDLSTLTSPPSGRIPVKTWVVPQLKRDAAYKWINDQITTNNTQMFIVCPFIEPSETNSTIKAASQEFEKIKTIFKSMSVGLLHGKLKPAQKDQVLEDFKLNKYQILVSTPVVEVGIDIPNATLMVIEDADHFGLAQLHQLRGRVGRSDKQSYCLLFAQKDSPRLQAMINHNSGLELAEIDLRLRGPGDVYGTAQHGTPIFKVANYADLQGVSEAKMVAETLLKNLKNYPLLKKLVEEDKIGSVIAN